MADPVSAPIAAAAAPTENQTTQETQPDLSKMTGAEARAYVESQKAKQSQGTKPAAPANTPSDPVKDAAKEAMRKYKLKVDGQEIEVDEDELKRGYGHQKAANKILQEGRLARKQAEEFLTMMRDPQKFFDVAAKLGHDPRKITEEFLASKLQEELMDPRDKELKTVKEKLKAHEEFKAAQEAQVQKQRDEALKAKFAKDYTDQFVSALQESNLPPTKHMVGKMAEYIHRAAGLKFQMTAQEAAQLVKEDVEMMVRRTVGESDGETLLKLLGEETANKIRKYDTGKLKNPEFGLKTPPDQGEPRERRVPNKRMTPTEWRQFNRGR